MKKLFIITGLLFLFIAASFAQELKCNISVNAQQIQGTNKKIFETLNKSLYEFMNNKAWTSNVFSVTEKIECNIMINISEQLSADEFRATVNIQSRRPVFNSSYNTVLLNYVDNNFTFRYVEFETLEFNENAFTTNLTSVLAFYAYVIIGLDYDSFSLEGGSEFFQKADRIVSNAQSSNDKGWKAFDAKNNRNRYWLIKNIIDKRYAPVREFMYRYHRLGLDVMDAKPNEGRAEIAEDLLLLQKIYRDKPDPFLHLMQVIFDAKSDEFVNIFSEALPDEKTRVYQILKEIDNANDTKYKKIQGQQ